MTGAKKKKIRKAKKMGVVSSIVWMLVFTIVFSILIAAIIAVYCSNILNTKWNETTNLAHTIAKKLSDLEYAEAETQEVLVASYKDVPGGFRGALVKTKEGEIVISYGDTLEEPADLFCITDSPFLRRYYGEDTIYLDAESADILSRYAQNGSVNIIGLLGENYANRAGSGDDWLQEEVKGFNLWYEMPYGDTSHILAIQMRVSISGMDYIFIVVACASIVILFAFLMIYHIISIIRLLINRRRAYNLLYLDPETSGKNKLYFEDRGRYLTRKKFRRDNSIFSGKNASPDYAVVSLSFTRFRSYVACNGMEKGTELLDKIYKYLEKSMTKKKELVVHYEKANFCLLLMYHEEAQLNDRLVQMMAGLSALEPGEKLAFEAGICHVESEVDDPVAVFNNASLARGRLDESSETKVAWFTEAMQEAQRWERRVENEMEGALSRGEFQMYLQPKYNARTEELGGAEALCRWQHPTEGLIPPYKFIPIFEQNGFILQLDDYMIREVAKFQAKLLASGKKLVPISVNVSRAHFTMDDLAEHIRDIVDAYEVPHEYVELELTESAFFDDKDVLLRTVEKMRSFGFPVSMDDFGAGYSSLNSLKELPLDVVKLDAEFFRGEDAENRGKVIVEDTISLAKKLGMHIVAEGIETREQVDFLADLECDLIQGYYFAKPMPIAEYESKAYTRIVTIENPKSV